MSGQDGRCRASVSLDGVVRVEWPPVGRHPDMKRFRTGVPLGQLNEVMGEDWVCQAIARHVCEDGDLDAWVFCNHCGRLMQVRDLAVYGEGAVCCPFRGCDGSGPDLWSMDDADDTNEWPPAADRSVGMFVGW